MDSADLYASAPVHRTECAKVNAAFLKCKMDHGNQNAHPSTCAHEGDAVTACLDGVERRLLGKCADAFAAYKTCLQTHELTGAKRYTTCQDLADALKQCDAKASGSI